MQRPYHAPAGPNLEAKTFLEQKILWNGFQQGAALSGSVLRLCSGHAEARGRRSASAGREELAVLVRRERVGGPGGAARSAESKREGYCVSILVVHQLTKNMVRLGAALKSARIGPKRVHLPPYRSIVVPESR